ncbi:winged helix-turn-helix domain-containing protein [Streptomyces sp. NPDC087300]|uniref:winged helix-turn-helix domain-containing protein n=1 Tax=Streptomyces sp. NPDC087300 TaxID=3365780 RepID=UPI0038001CA5
MRAPISKADLAARVKALQQRAAGRRTPVLDSAGTLHYDAQSVSISSTQTELMELFVEHFGSVVHRGELKQRLAETANGDPSRNSLDLHIMRLRRRVAAVNLAIRTAWGRGYLLEPCEESENVDRTRAHGA